MPAPKFKTIQVAELYEQMRGRDHSDFPFRDADYSLGSYAPATDFTPYIAAWLASGDLEAIQELWQFLTYEGDASRYALQRALSARLPFWIHLADWQQHELRAIHILTIRACLTQRVEEVSYVGSALAAATISCLPIQIDETKVDRLIRAAKPEVKENSPFDGLRGKSGAAEFSVEKAQSPLGAESDIVERLTLIPPMSRLVVHDYVARGWGQGLLRYSLYYGERMYGCSTKLNQHYVDWAQFFQPPDDTAKVPAAVTKQILSDALLAANLDFKRGDGRQALIEKARCKSGLLSSLILLAYPEQKELRPEFSSAIKEWSFRVRSVEAAASGVLKFLGTSTL